MSAVWQLSRYKLKRHWQLTIIDLSRLLWIWCVKIVGSILNLSQKLVGAFYGGNLQCFPCPLSTWVPREMSLFLKSDKLQNDGSPLSSVPGTHREALGSAMSRFDSLLAAPDLFILPSTRYLVKNKCSEDVRAEADVRTDNCGLCASENVSR